MKSSTTIGVDSFACDCTFINTYGLLCVCELDRYSQISDLISLLSIYVHWKVLSISDIDNTNDSWGDLTLTNEGVALLKRLSLLDMDRKMTLHNKVWELTFLDTTSMRLAIKKIKTKGASKPVKYNKCEPLMWERVDEINTMVGSLRTANVARKDVSIKKQTKKILIWMNFLIHCNSSL